MYDTGYWVDLLGMTLYEQNDNLITLGYAPDQVLKFPTSFLLFF